MLVQHPSIAHRGFSTHPFSLIGRLIAFVILAGVMGVSAAPSAPIEIGIRDESLNPVRAALFGQFMERASWGEPGPEAAFVPEPPYLQPKALALLESMRIPLIRFPGGTDIDFIDWRDLIDNAAGRDDPSRPVTTRREGDTITNRFGFDEYFAVRDRLECETMLVLNLLDATAKRKPLHQAALDAVGLIAYTNAAIGAKLPAGMPDWPAARALNGHPKPYGVQYVQIGNELWHGESKIEAIKKGSPGATDKEIADWITECVREYVRVIREVDPDIVIAIDDKCVFGAHEIYLADPLVRREVGMATYHVYGPWRAEKVETEKGDISAADLSAEDWWAAWTSTPGKPNAEGLVDALPKETRDAIALGYKIGVTEWNWNGWFHQKPDPAPPLEFPLASGLGAAAYLHNLMRHGGEVVLATQSMLIGRKWGITAVRVDPEGIVDPYFFPQGQVTGFYSRHHGDERLAILTSKIPLVCVKVEGHPGSPGGALVDPVATRRGDRIFLHLVHRGLRDATPVRVRLPDGWEVKGTATLRTLAGDPFESAKDRGPQSVFTETATPVDLGEPIELPPASVSVLEIPAPRPSGP